MYRAVTEIFNFRILNSLNYNIMALPGLVIIFLFQIGLIYDFIKDKNVCLKITFNLLEKYYTVIIIIILISYGINLYRGI